MAVKALSRGEPVDRQRFDREARVLAGLTHPGLVAVSDAGEEEDDALFMVLELIDGPTLSARLADGPMAGDEVRKVGGDLAATLAYVHSQGIVHRDIKPSNVFFDGTNRVRLGDFGIARLDDTTALTQTDTAIGTAAYMAPEQIEGRSATDRSDVYALGLVLLECLTGRHPFPGPAPASALARLSSDPEVPDDLPAPWPARLRSMTDRDPSRRPDAATVALTLGDEAPAVAGTATEPIAVTATQSMPAAAPMPVAPAVEPEPRRRRALLAVAAALVVLLLVAAGLAARDDDPPPADADPAATTTVAPTTAPATTAAPTTAPPTTVPPTTVPATTAAPTVDCAALEAEKEALEEEKRQINEQYHDDRETRDQLLEELKDRKDAIDAQLRESC